MGLLGSTWVYLRRLEQSNLNVADWDWDGISPDRSISRSPSGDNKDNDGNYNNDDDNDNKYNNDNEDNKYNNVDVEDNGDNDGHDKDGKSY